MKTFVRLMIAVVAAVAVGGAATLFAQTTDTFTHVPFSFTIGSASMPPDTYRVAPLPGQTSVFLVSGARQGAIVITRPEGRTMTADTPELVFHRYGDRRFLREIRMAGGVGFSVPESRVEREAEERLAAGSKLEVIVVRAGSTRAADGRGE